MSRVLYTPSAERDLSGPTGCQFSLSNHAAEFSMFGFLLSSLKVDGDRLLGRRGFRTWTEILPSEIVIVEEFGINPPFLNVQTTKGSFRVYIFSRHYNDVLSFLRLHVDCRFCETFVHKWNVLIWKRHFHFLPLIKHAMLAPFYAGRALIRGIEKTIQHRD